MILIEKEESIKMDLREINYEVGNWLRTDTNIEFGTGSSTACWFS
jgi:hypothetical protein